MVFGACTIRMCAPRGGFGKDGNNDVQTHLVNALRRDIHRYRQTLRNTLEAQLIFDIKKHRTIDDHFSSKRKAIIETAEQSKTTIGMKKAYYETRGKLIIDKTYDAMLEQLRALQAELARELESLKNDELRMVEDIEQFEHRMAVQRSSGHFFKSLYERDPAKPVGKSLEMLRHDEETKVPSLWELAFVFVMKILSM